MDFNQIETKIITLIFMKDNSLFISEKDQVGIPRKKNSVLYYMISPYQPLQYIIQQK